jgi:DNA-binding transcriptional MerR regulator
LRFWEEKFDALRPARNKKGNRLYTPADVDTVRMIYHLVKERKMKLEVARKNLKDNSEAASRDARIVERLLNVRSLLAQIKADLAGGGEAFADYSGEEARQVAAEPKNSELQKTESHCAALPCAESRNIAPINADISKLPFEEQPLFELLPEFEPEPATDIFARDGEYVPHPEEHSDDLKHDTTRRAVIEQTLF